MARSGQQGLSAMSMWLNEVCEHQLAFSPDADNAPLPTGWPAIDQKITGLQRGQILALAAGRQIGKTAFALNLIREIGINQGKETLLFAPRASGAELTLRLLAAESAIDLQRLRTGKLHEAEWPGFSEAIGRLHKAPIHMAADHDYCPTRICLEAMQSGQPALLVIDDLAAITRNMRSKSPNEALRTLKLLAATLGAAIVVTITLPASLARRHQHRPSLADLAAIGISLAQLDQVLLLHREECFSLETPDKGIAEIHIAAQHNGPSGSIVRMLFVSEHQCFLSIRKSSDTPTFMGAA